MRENVQDYEDERYMNVAQVILLDIVLTVSLAVALKLAGNSLFVSVIGAWLGGCILTMGALSGLYWVRSVGMRLTGPATQNQQSRSAPPLVSSEITDPMELWEADRMLELDHAYASGELDQARRGTDVSVDEMAQMWADDAAADVPRDRRTQSDRRQTVSPGRTDRRRAAG